MINCKKIPHFLQRSLYNVLYFKSHHCNFSIQCVREMHQHIIYMLSYWCQNILTRTTEVMIVNELGKTCYVMWTASGIVKKKNNCSVVRQCLAKSSYKCTTAILKVSWIKIFYQKLRYCKTIFAILWIFSI